MGPLYYSDKGSVTAAFRIPGEFLNLKEELPMGGEDLSAWRPLLIHDASITSKISLLLNLLTKRGWTGRSGARTVCKGKCSSGVREGSSGWKIEAGLMRERRVSLFLEGKNWVLAGSGEAMKMASSSFVVGS